MTARSLLRLSLARWAIPRAATADFASDTLSVVAVRETIRANALFRHNNWKASLILNNTSIHSRLGLEFKAEEDSQTEWVRRGMPREQIPVKKKMIYV